MWSPILAQDNQTLVSLQHLNRSDGKDDFFITTAEYDHQSTKNRFLIRPKRQIYGTENYAIQKIGILEQTEWKVKRLYLVAKDSQEPTTYSLLTLDQDDLNLVHQFQIPFVAAQIELLDGPIICFRDHQSIYVVGYSSQQPNVWSEILPRTSLEHLDDSFKDYPGALSIAAMTKPAGTKSTIYLQVKPPKSSLCISLSQEEPSILTRIADIKPRDVICYCVLEEEEPIDTYCSMLPSKLCSNKKVFVGMKDKVLVVYEHGVAICSRRLQLDPESIKVAKLSGDIPVVIVQYSDDKRTVQILSGDGALRLLQQFEVVGAVLVADFQCLGADQILLLRSKYIQRNRQKAPSLEKQLQHYTMMTAVDVVEEGHIKIKSTGHGPRKRSRRERSSKSKDAKQSVEENKENRGALKPKTQVAGITFCGDKTDDRRKQLETITKSLDTLCTNTVQALERAESQNRDKMLILSDLDYVAEQNTATGGADVQSRLGVKMVPLILPRLTENSEKVATDSCDKNNPPKVEARFINFGMLVAAKAMKFVLRVRNTGMSELKMLSVLVTSREVSLTNESSYVHTLPPEEEAKFIVEVGFDLAEMIDEARIVFLLKGHSCLSEIKKTTFLHPILSYALSADKLLGIGTKVNVRDQLLTVEMYCLSETMDLSSLPTKLRESRILTATAIEGTQNHSSYSDISCECTVHSRSYAKLVLMASSSMQMKLLCKKIRLLLNDDILLLPNVSSNEALQCIETAYSTLSDEVSFIQTSIMELDDQDEVQVDQTLSTILEKMKLSNAAMNNMQRQMKQRTELHPGTV